MTRVLTLYQGADLDPDWDYSDWVEWPDCEFGTRCNNGESTQGELRVRDVLGETGNDGSLPGGLTYRGISAHNVMTLTEDASGAEKHIWRGWVIPKDYTRGTQKAARAREIRVALEDNNAELRGIIVGRDGAESRPAETDVARVLWLLDAYFDGSVRASTVIGDAFVPNTNTVVMPAKDYENVTPEEVLRDCATSADKRFWVILNDDGTQDLFYDAIDSAAYASTLAIRQTGTPTEVDGTTTFEPIWDVGPASREDGQGLLSGVKVVGAGEVSAYVSHAGTEDDYNHYEEVIYDDQATNNSEALVKANVILGVRRFEERTYSCSILVPANRIHLIKAGMNITIQAKVIPDADDQVVTRRIAQLKLRVYSPELYKVALQLDRPLRVAARSNGTPSGLHLCRDGDCGGGDINDFAGKTWQTSANGTHDITASYVLVSAPDNEAAANWLDLTEWDGDPLDFRALVSTTHDVTHADDQGGSIIIAESSGTGASGPTLVPDKAFKWQVTRHNTGDVRVSVFATNDLFADQSVDLFTIDQGEKFWIRCNLTASEINMKAWPIDDPEPGSWQATAAGPGGDLLVIMADANVFSQTKMFDEATEFKLYSLDIESGYACPSCIHGGPARTSTNDTDAAPAGHQHDYAAAGGTTGQVLAKLSDADWDTEWVDDAGGVVVQDEGTPLATDASTLNFVGPGVVASGAGATKTITISGGDSPWEEVTPDEVWRLKDDVYVLSSSDDSVYTWWGSAGTPVASGFFKLFALGGIDLNANDGTPGGGSTDKHYLIGGHGLVVPILSADPSGGNSENGQVYYNDTDDKFRAYQNGAWVDVIGGGGAGMAGELVTDTIIGDGATDTFALSVAPTGTWALVSTNGADLLPSEFAIVASDVVFDVAPETDAEVLVTFITGGFTVPAVDPGDIADPTLATAEDVANKLNDLMAELRTAGIIA